MDSAKVALLEQRQDQLDSTVKEMVTSVKDLTGELSKLTVTMHESISEGRSTREQMSRVYANIESNQKRINNLETATAANQPWIDLVKSINSRVWFVIIGSAASIGYLLIKLGV